MDLWRVFLTSILIAAVQGQLANITQINGGPFTVTCEPGRLTIPQAVTTVFTLSIEITYQSAQPQSIVIYSPFSPINITKNFTPNRQWQINAQGTTRSTMKLELLILDAVCSDAGVYRCNATFLPLATPGSSSSADRMQNISGKANTDDPILTLSHHNGIEPDVSTNTEGEVVSLSCKVRGPYGLTFSWLTGSAGGSIFAPPPIANNIQTVTPSPPTATASPCTQYQYESIFNITVQADVMIYICVVNDGSNEVTQKNFTIDGNPSR